MLQSGFFDTLRRPSGLPVLFAHYELFADAIKTLIFLGLRAVLVSVNLPDLRDELIRFEGWHSGYVVFIHMRDTVRRIFKYAVVDRLILYDPTIKAVLPKGARGTHRAITDDERCLIARTEHKLRPAVMLYAGLRRGEVLALNVDRDVDFEEDVIYVREAVRFEGGQHPVIVDPKAEAGARTIPLLGVLRDEFVGIHGLVAQSQHGGLMTENA